MTSRTKVWQTPNLRPRNRKIRNRHVQRYSQTISEEAVAWSKANPIKYTSDFKCAYEKEGSLLETESLKENQMDKLLPRFQVQKTGPNAELKCKSKEDQSPIPSFLFELQFLLMAFLGAKKIQINEVDMLFTASCQKMVQS